MRGGRAAAPRGRKAWALLACLLLSERALTRERLAGLLFAEAADPLATLRWNLSVLRRLLGGEVVLAREPLRLELPGDAVADVTVLASGTWADVLALPGIGRELLEGMSFPDCPAFETWLLAERARHAGLSQALFQEAARARLAKGDAGAAIDAATSLVALDPFDEEGQALLVHAYAASGDRVSAQRQLAACTELFRRELGIEPSARLQAALQREPKHQEAGRSLTAVQAQVEAGEAAINAGALEAGFVQLRQAAVEAGARGDSELEGKALFTLGSALVHAVRGRDGEGAQMLHRALALSESAGNLELALRARRELGFIEVMAGRYGRARLWLEEALQNALEEPAERAWLEATLGIVLSDCGRYGAAVPRLEAAVDLARESGPPKNLAWALSFLGRAHLLLGDLGRARAALESSVDISRSSWPYFVPWAEALLAEIELQERRAGPAAVTFEHAFALACQIGDPCWEAMGQRGLGLCALRRGRGAEAIELLEDAYGRARRFPDSYLWVAAYCLEALAAAAVAQHSPRATAWVAELAALSARTGMRELLVMAQLHKATLGEPGAMEGALTIAADVDNPWLGERLASHAASHV